MKGPSDMTPLSTPPPEPRPTHPDQSSVIETLSMECQKAYVVIREFKWGGDFGREVLGVCASIEIAENLEASYGNMERHERRNGTWNGGTTVEIDWIECDVRGVIPPPEVVRS